MEAFAVGPDEVLRLLHRLPPRERLRVVVQALPGLEQDLPATVSGSDFWEGADVQTLAARQGVQPVDDFDALLGGWPDDESVDGFIVALRERRHQNPADVST